MAELSKQTCPRRVGEAGPWERGDNLDRWEEDDTCSFCGSLNPETFLKRIEARDVEIIPTDKNYKAYLRNTIGQPFKQTSRTDKDMSGDRSKWVWETRETSQVKVYFQHLSVEQMNKFVDLLNEKKMIFSYPGYFYRLPYFLVVKNKE